MNNRDALIEAVISDIQAVLLKETLLANDLYRVSDIAKMGAAICNSLGQPTEGVHFANLLEESVYKAPSLHAALKQRAFNGETALQQKYNKLEELQTHVNLNMLGSGVAAVEDEKTVLKMKLQEAETRLADQASKLALVSGATTLLLESGTKAKKPRKKATKAE